MMWVRSRYDRLGGMRYIELFALASDYPELWFVENVEFKPEDHRLDINLNFKSGRLTASETDGYHRSLAGTKVAPQSKTMIAAAGTMECEPARAT